MASAAEMVDALCLTEPSADSLPAPHLNRDEPDDVDSGLSKGFDRVLDVHDTLDGRIVRKDRGVDRSGRRSRISTTVNCRYIEDDEVIL
jgi:hypothetical protein